MEMEKIAEPMKEEAKMYFRQLNDREKQLLLMIRPTTFQDIVDEVRKYYDDMRYARKHLTHLHNS